jgi:hypothetical protein
MARNPRQAALYEVINRNKFKDAQQKALERIGAVPKAQNKPQVVELHKVTEQPAVQQSTVVIQEPKAAIQQESVETPVVRAVTETIKTEPPTAATAETVKEAVKTEISVKPNRPESVWTARPKPVRIYQDRIELCLSWQIAGLSVLAMLAIFLVFFRLGRMSVSAAPEEKQQSAVIRTDDIKPTAPAVVNPAPAVETPAPKLIEPMGDNVIVIASYNLQSHLEPVKAYFAQYGIATEIIRSDQTRSYLLVTQNRYDSINKPGSDGYEMKKKIMSVGANYKPPVGSGLESFGPKPFQDVYGMKVK